ncbi:hypothetical protein ACEPPN_000519 [Leptodophora sp. 'Broadleaf-Isolate-01']
MEEEDLYGATRRAIRQKTVEDPVSQTDSLFGGTGANELDALLAEEEMMQSTTSKPAPVFSKTVARDEIDDDEVDVMNVMDDM